MKPYYVMVHFAGPYVSGFVVPRAKDEKDAIRQLRILLWAQLQIALKREKKYGMSYGSDRNSVKIKEFIRSLKRPWRNAGNNRDTTVYTRATVSKDPVVKITELMLPCIAGYWLDEIPAGHICNQSNQWHVSRLRD